MARIFSTINRSKAKGFFHTERTYFFVRFTFARFLSSLAFLFFSLLPLFSGCSPHSFRTIESKFKKRENFIVLIQLWKLWWHCAKTLGNAHSNPSKLILTIISNYIAIISAPETPFGVYSHIFFFFILLSLSSNFVLLIIFCHKFIVEIVRHVLAQQMSKLKYALCASDKEGIGKQKCVEGKNVEAKVIDLINFCHFTF